MSRYDSPDPDPHRFTITDYTYHHEDPTTTTPTLTSVGTSTSIAKPLPAAVSTLSQSQARPRDGSGSSIITSRQSSKSSQVSAGSSSKIRPLPSIPRDPLSLSFSPTSPVAGPSSSSYVTSPVTITSASGSGSGSGSASGHSFITRSPIGESSSSYHPRPPAVRTISDRKVKQPENSLGIQTRPGRNGSGGSSHHQLRLHEPGPSLATPVPTPLPHTSPSLSPLPSDSPPSPSLSERGEPSSRVSTEIDPLPSVHDSVFTQNDYFDRRSRHVDEREHDEKDLDHKDVYAAPALARNTSEVKHVGFWRRIIPASWVCRWLIFVVILESAVDLAILTNILWRFNRTVKSELSSELIWQNKRRLPIYLIIFGLAHLWQIVLTIIAIKYKNTMQVVAVSLFNYAFLAYAVMMLYELRKILGDLNESLRDIDPDAPPDQIFTIPLNVLTAVLIGAIAIGCVGLTVLAYCIRREFGWQKYRFLGADLQIRKLYQRFQVFECICYFTAFFCAGFGIQFIWLVLQPTDVEYIITWIMFPLLLLLLLFGRFAAKYEKKWMMFIFLIGILGGLAYFIFKMVRIWQQVDTVYQNLSLSLTVFDAFSILSLAACGVWAIWVGSGFDQGLKQAVVRSGGGSIASAMRIWRTKSVESDVEMSEKEREAQVIAQRRISID